MGRVEQLLVFAISHLRCALQISTIERVARSAEITVAPKAPANVIGLLIVHGNIVPVLDIRRLFRLPPQEMTLDDHIIVARTSSRAMAIIVDAVIGVTECDGQDILAPERLYPGIAYLEGIARLQDGILFIYNLDTFLSSTEKAEIEDLLTESNPIPADQEA
jgi:purine-binding chemotaxis protein CheW